MIRHIVMWTLADQTADTKAANMSKMKEMLENLVGKIEGLRCLEVNPNIKDGGYDLCLYSEFDNIDALEHYRTHPLHKEVQKFVHSVISERGFCDSEIN